jgi:peptidoglycan/LPS O-acetylase OafA/YrhL
VTTLDQALRANRGVGPGFHMLRHALAVVILAHHCRVAVFGVETTAAYAGKGSLVAVSDAAGAGLHLGPILTELLRPGLFALVGMFFALSGFLVTGSSLRNNSVKVFFANRALRILPALSVEVSLSALVLGPLVTILPLSEYFSDFQFFRYFGNIVGHVTFQLPGVFAHNPWPNMVNANLWTLPPEFWCYFLMFAAMVTGVVLQPKRINAMVCLALVLAIILGIADPGRFSIREDNTHFTVGYIVLMFFFGVVFFVNADRIVMDKWLALACAAGYYVLTLFDTLGALSGVFLTYCTVYVGMMKFPTFDRLLKNDLSYGIYLYGFPITQAAIFFLLPLIGGLPHVAQYLVILPITVALTALFSTLSWKYIEKPALGLRKYVLRSEARRAAAPNGVPAAEPRPST